jgi:hypothetical protein
MQPNGPQGYYQPDQPPAAPAPVAPPQVQSVDPAALQAALDEPAPAAAQPVDPQTSDPNLLNDEGDGDEEYYDDEEVSDMEPVTWSAHEYIHQEKGTMWFTIFGIVIAALVAVSIFLMNSISFAILLVVIAVVVIVSLRRPPRELTYTLNDEGLSVDGKIHHFSNFKSFGVIHDSGEYSVMLIPIQRFQPGVTVYFPEELGEEIVDALGAHLPMKDLKLDVVDRVVRLLRL